MTREQARLLGFLDELEKVAKVLTAKGRKRIKPENFALPGGRYPIHDLSHARNALARVAQHGTPTEQEIVRKKVHERYPNIGKAGKSGHEAEKARK